MTQKISSSNIETATLASFSGPTIANVSIANSTYTLLDDTAVSNAGGYVVITGSNFQSGAQVLFGSTSACTVTFVDSTQLNVQVPALTAGSYVVYVQNGDGSTAIKLNGITSSPIPVWSTGSTLTEQGSGTPISISLSATSDSNVAYSVANGSSLPSGTTLAANGLFSGTITTVNETTYNFSVNAIDAENQETLRAFSVTVTIGDEFYNLTTLHLVGDGTNNANNKVFRDSSNNNFTITRNGNTTQGTFSPFSQTGWSNYFDGTGDFLSIANNAALNPGTSDFVMEAWVYITGTTGNNQGINGKGTAGTDGYSFFVTNGLVLSFIWNGTGGTTITAGTLSLNTWNHVAVVRNSNVIRLYLNGVGAVSSTACTTDITSTATKFIGQARGANPILGYMSNYRMIKGTLPSGYNATSSTIPVPTTTLTAVTNTTVLTCQSNRFIDNSTNTFTITRNGDTSVQTFSPFAPTAAYSATTNGGSGYFDGTGDYLSTPSGNTAFNFSATKDMTFECYFYATQSLTTNCLFDINECVPFRFVLSSTGLTWQATGSGGTIASASNTWVLNRWYHLACVRSLNTLYIFIDGILSVSASYSDNWTYVGSSSVFVGCNRGDTWFFPGYISNVRLLKGTALYTSNFIPPTAPLTNITNTSLLLNFTNAGITDATSRNVFETVGDAKISTVQSKWGGSSILFDGTGDALIAPYSPLFNLGTGQFTIEAWVNFSALSSNRLIFDTYTAASTGGGYQLYWRGTGTSITFYGNGVVIAQSTFTSHVTGTWYHIAVTRDSVNSLRIFVDGTQYANTTYSTALNIASTAKIGVGIQASTLTNDLSGYVDDLRVTLGQARYTSNFTAPTAAFKTR
jgi:hypothetical protein